jgi:hypothetical protein
MPLVATDSEEADVEQDVVTGQLQKGWLRAELRFVRNGALILTGGLVLAVVAAVFGKTGVAHELQPAFLLIGGVGVIIGLVWIAGGLVEPRLRRRGQ